MTIEFIIKAIQLLGGLAMFLYGMELMGDGLKQGSGAALKNVLGKMTQNVVMGVLTGALVTAIIQSSTATIVLTVGLIGAGILNLKQAVGIVMGANIGTTVTAQIIRLMDIDKSDSILAFFNPDTLAPLALVLGIVLFMFIGKNVSKNVGMICLGFGILFTGLSLMTGAVEGLENSELFKNIIAYFADMPLMSLLIGLVLTVIMQSSSATVGILQTLASSTGTITFDVVYPMIMGINIGTCVTTALVCSIGTGKDAKRTGVVHIVFNVVGTIIFMVAMALLRSFGAFEGLWGRVSDSGTIANFQTVFNLVTAVILLPFAGLLMKTACAVVKEDPPKENKYPELSALDKKLMISPTVALGQAGRSLGVMARAALDNTKLALAQFRGYDEARAAEIADCEEKLDNFADASDNFLIELFQYVENERDNRQLNMVMQCVPAVERIGDYATNYDEMAKKLHDAGQSFSESAQRELDILGGAVEEIIGLTAAALQQDDENIARRIEPLEEVIDDMVLLLRDRHAARLRQGICTVDTSLVFMEVLTLLERAADQCSSIAMLMLGRHNEDIMKNHHLYLQELHESGDLSYVNELEGRKAEFLSPLESVQ
ncbi:MAG: Na/Pi cotransporter family protein [Oscillospiraceae bacterium]|nr:Na/Pi cotransporter family protein [Oscillospiraceae bacterium]